MAQLPQILPYTSRLPIGGSEAFNPRREAASSGAGLVELGNALQEVAYKDAVVKANDAITNIQAGVEQRSVKLREQAQGGVDGYTPKALEVFDSIAAEQMKGLNPQAQLMVRQASKRMRVKYATESLEFEAAAKQGQRFKDLQKAQDTSAVAVELNPSSWLESGARQLEAINALGLLPEQRLKLSQRADAVLSEAAGHGYAKQDPLGTLNRLTDPKDELFGSMPLQVRDQVKRVAQGQLVDSQAQSILAVYSAGGASAGARALSMIDDKASIVPPELRDEVRSKVDTGVGQLRQQRQVQYADQLASLESQIATDTTSSDTVDAAHTLFSNGTFTPMEYASVRARIADSQDRAMKQRKGVVDIGALVAAGIPLDPKSTDQMKSLNLAFQSMVKTEPPGSAGWQAQALALTHATRVLPQDAESYLNSAARSPTPAIAAGAAQFYDALANNAPEALTEIDPSTKAFAASASDMIKNGAQPAVAAEAARAIVFDAKPDLIEMRRKAFNEKPAGGTSIADQVKASIPGYIGQDFSAGLLHSNPIPTDSLQADFQSQARSYYLKTGNAKLAQDLAWRDLKNIYGPTLVNGVSMVAPFPVERFGLTPAEVRTEIDELVKQHPPRDGSTAADIHVVPDSLTLAQVTDALTGKRVDPSYSLVTKSGDLLTDENGMRLRYFVPDYQTRVKKLQDAQAAQAAQLVESAKAHRELQQEARDANRFGPARPF